MGSRILPIRAHARSTGPVRAFDTRLLPVARMGPTHGRGVIRKMTPKMHFFCGLKAFFPEWLVCLA